MFTDGRRGEELMTLGRHPRGAVAAAAELCRDICQSSLIHASSGPPSRVHQIGTSSSNRRLLLSSPV